MDYVNFVEDLASKRRTITDLARFISTRTDHNPNYSLLLGAGCSISSGIRSAAALAELWRKELYFSLAGNQATSEATAQNQQEYLRSREGAWYDPSREYSSLFEKRYDLQRQRRMFVETEVAGKIPSIGYAYLTALVKQNYFNTIFTTNFDDLLNEAFYVYSDQRPIVCAQDSSINSITVTSKRPKIIKLHGDYLFDDLKSTVRETESLEQNMKAKFAEFAKEYGLVIVGYSGGDRSIMDAISALLKNEWFLNGGIYWCIRKGSYISEELRKLMWKERVYFVEIDGFDELFAELYSSQNDGDVLPAAALSATHRPIDITNSLLKSDTAFPTTSEILKKAREKLERSSKRTALAGMLFKPRDEENQNFPGSNLNDDEMLLVTEIRQLLEIGDYKTSIEKTKTILSTTISQNLKLQLLRVLVRAHIMADDRGQALAVAEQLIDIQPLMASGHLLKASVLQNSSEIMICIDAAITANPYSVEAHLERARQAITQSLLVYGEKKNQLITNAIESINKSLTLDPSWRNYGWRMKFDAIAKIEKQKHKITSEKQALINELNKQNPYSYSVLSMRTHMIDEGSSIDSCKELLEDFNTAFKKSESTADSFNELRVLIYKKCNARDLLKSFVLKLTRDPETLKDADLAVATANALRDDFGMDDEAINLLCATLDYEFDSDALSALIDALRDLKKLDEADALLTKWRKRISKNFHAELFSRILEARGDFVKYLELLDDKENLSGEKEGHKRIYILLKMEDFVAAEKLARDFLEPINFTPEASIYIVNLEFARKRRGKNPDRARLDAVAALDPDPEVRAAIAAILDKKGEVVLHTKAAVKKSRTLRYLMADWPVLDPFKADPDFIAALASS